MSGDLRVCYQPSQTDEYSLIDFLVSHTIPCEQNVAPQQLNQFSDRGGDAAQRVGGQHWLWNVRSGN